MAACKTRLPYLFVKGWRQSRIRIQLPHLFSVNREKLFLLNPRRSRVQTILHDLLLGLNGLGNGLILIDVHAV